MLDLVKLRILAISIELDFSWFCTLRGLADVEVGEIGKLTMPGMLFFDSPSDEDSGKGIFGKSCEKEGCMTEVISDTEVSCVLLAEAAHGTMERACSSEAKVLAKDS